MDHNKEHIVNLIGYQRKALRLLNLGIQNENVVHLLNQRPDQKKELLNIKPFLESSLAKNIERNDQIYKKPEPSEEKLPVPFETPKEYIITPKEPDQIALEYESKNAVPFTNLMDNECKGFIN